MAYTSFVVRNTISNNGSALRRTNVTQNSTTPNGSGTIVYDSALRADGFFIPVPQEYLDSTFEVNVYRRDEVSIAWTIATPLVETPEDTDFEPVELLIRASSTGEPVTANDGTLVKSYTYVDYKESFVDSNRPYIVDGGWIYYALFIKYANIAGDAFYEKVADLSVQIPYNFNSTENLWKRIPTYYRELDETYAKNTPGYDHEVGPLYRYVDLFGWELDRLRTTIYDTMRVNDPDVVHSSAIDALAIQTGVEFGKNALGTTKLRTILNNIGYIRRTKGTQDSVEAYISALSGCGVSVVTNFNETKWLTTNVFSGDEVNGIAYGNGKWVAVGYGGKTSTSTDGITWSTVTTVGNTRSLNAVAYGNGLWIAVGVSASNSATPCIYKSTDGVTWTGVFNSASTGYYLLRDVSYANGVWVAVGQSTLSPLLCTSTDGTTWTIKSTGITGNYQLHDVAYGNNKWIATSTSQQLVISTDNGSTWSASLPATLPASQYTAIYYSDDVWVIALSNFIYRSLDNGVTWVAASINPDTSEVIGFSKINNIWLTAGPDGDVSSSTDNGDNWYQIYLGESINDIAIGEKRVIVARTNNVATNHLIVDFNVHPMRVNLFTDPLFSNASDTTYDNGTTDVYFTNLEQSGRQYGWGVVTKSSVSGTAPTVATAGGVLSITLPAGSGTTEIAVYSRGEFKYNPELTYYGSAVSSHDFTTRFSLRSYFESLHNLDFFDSWNDLAASGAYPLFNNVRRTVASIPSPDPVVSEVVVPVFYFSVANNESSPTVVTFSEPLFEYKNSSGEFFTGSTPMGGFIPNANIEGNPSAGLYDYHWGANGSGDPGRDFSFYTLDFQRSKSVTEDVVSNSVMPVTLVNGTDYKINWEVLE